MGGETLRRGGQESPIGPETIRVNGRGSGTDRIGVGSEAQWDHPNNPVSFQGQGDGGAQGPDRRASQRQCRSVGPSGRSRPEAGGGGGASSSSGRGADPGGGKEHEVARRLPEVL